MFSVYQVVDKTKPISEIPQWFAGSYLNYAENLLRYDDDRVAIYATSEFFLFCLQPLEYIYLYSMYLISKYNTK